MKFIKFAKISLFIFFINIVNIDYLLSDTNTNSIIKIFCKESVKTEFKKNNLKYEESIGEEVCNCYLKNISRDISHKNSITKCKLEKFKKN